MSGCATTNGSAKVTKCRLEYLCETRTHGGRFEGVADADLGDVSALTDCR
jgi:hypothetical protein